MAELRTAPGMRERSPGVWELIVEAGRDPLTGKRRQVSRTFRGNLRDAKKARAALLVDVGKGRHTGARATLDDLFAEWIIELRRKGRSPNTVRGYELVCERNIKPTLGAMPVTKVTPKTLTDLYGAHQARGLAARSVYQVHACLSSMSPRPADGGGGTPIRPSGPTLRRWIQPQFRQRSWLAPPPTPSRLRRLKPELAGEPLLSQLLLLQPHSLPDPSAAAPALAVGPARCSGGQSASPAAAPVDARSGWGSSWPCLSPQTAEGSVRRRGAVSPLDTVGSATKLAWPLNSERSPNWHSGWVLSRGG